MIIGGYIMESSKKQALKMIGHNDALMDEAFFKEEGQGKDNATGTTNNAGKKWAPALTKDKNNWSWLIRQRSYQAHE